MTATIALTGGSGFIGRRFAQRARNCGYRVRHLTRRPTSDFPADDEVRAFDLGSEDVDLRGCTTLVHLAAYIPRNHADPDEAEPCWRTNALGTLRLFEAAAAAGIGRIVQTTSANAYASSDAPSEKAAMFPRSRGYYLGSKILQEIYATELCQAKGLALATLRLGSVYGPGQTSGALATMIVASFENRPIQVSDGGRFGADMVYVDDVASALMRVVECDYVGPLNVGSGSRTTIAALAAMIAERMQAQTTVHPAGSEGIDRGFPALDISRLLSLGHQPTLLPAGLDATVRAERHKQAERAPARRPSC